MQKTQREGVVYLNLVKPEAVLELMMGYREDESSPVLARFIETVHSMNLLNIVR